MIKLKIDVTKITKQKLYQGKKGLYLNCVLIETPNSEYSDYMIVEESTKEQRENKEKGVILGNATNIAQTSEVVDTVPSEQAVNDLPFIVTILLAVGGTISMLI